MEHKFHRVFSYYEKIKQFHNKFKNPRLTECLQNVSLQDFSVPLICKYTLLSKGEYIKPWFSTTCLIIKPFIYSLFHRAHERKGGFQ